MAQTESSLYLQTLSSIMNKIAQEVIDNAETGPEALMYIDAAKLFENRQAKPEELKAMLKRVLGGSRTKPLKVAKLALDALQKESGVVANAKKRASGKAKPDPGSYN